MLNPLYFRLAASTGGNRQSYISSGLPVQEEIGGEHLVQNSNMKPHTLHENLKLCAVRSDCMGVCSRLLYFLLVSGLLDLQLVCKDHLLYVSCALPFSKVEFTYLFLDVYD